MPRPRKWTDAELRDSIAAVAAGTADQAAECARLGIAAQTWRAARRRLRAAESATPAPDEDIPSAAPVASTPAGTRRPDRGPTGAADLTADALTALAVAAVNLSATVICGIYSIPDSERASLSVTDSERRELAAVAPAAIPWIAARIANPEVVGVVMFGSVLVAMVAGRLGRAGRISRAVKAAEVAAVAGAVEATDAPGT